MDVIKIPIKYAINDFRYSPRAIPIAKCLLSSEDFFVYGNPLEDIFKQIAISKGYFDLKKEYSLRLLREDLDNILYIAENQLTSFNYKRYDYGYYENKKNFDFFYNTAIECLKTREVAIYYTGYK